MVKDDSNHSWNVEKEYKITDQQYDAVKQSVDKDTQNPPNYNLNTNNCTDWVDKEAATAGVTLPDASGTWTGGGGQNPGALGQALVQQGATVQQPKADEGSSGSSSGDNSSSN